VKPHEGPLSDDTLAVVERLSGFAERRGRTMVELAIAWIAAHRPVASVIAGATLPEQVRANVAAADWELDDGDLAEIDALVAPG
jgi:aryl-alcohol dehydrogenase-like predicted oxidoreductase